jgi:REP element-mobilizing transposase RayT
MTRTNFPLAYHITFGTYGTRLHGSDRPTVDRSQNKFGDPIIGRDAEWEMVEKSLLKFPPRILTLEQRLFVEATIPSICMRGGWEYVTTAAAKDHVHNIIRANVEGLDVRKWLKRWISQAMNERWPLLPGQVWWAECGSVKWIWEEDYFGRAEKYVSDQRTTPK